MVAYLAEIRMFAGETPPPNWAICDGSLLPVGKYPALAALLNNTYGGDGQNAFGLPDLRGRIPVGQGRAEGLWNHALGEEGGVETVTLRTGQMPAHSHSFFATPTYATTPTAGPTVGYASPPPTTSGYVTSAEAPSVSAPLAQEAVSEVGLGQPHDNMMPTLCLNYIICLAGADPSRS